MKFYGKPNMGVYELRRDRKSRDNIFQRRKLLCRFDAAGEYETEDPALIRRLERKFRHEDSAPLYHCKKCDFTCSDRIELMQHYKKEHPKDGGG